MISDHYICLYISGMAALRGTTIPGEVYAWIIVFVLPVNSAINPILYTFAAHNPLKVCIPLSTSNRLPTRGQ